MVVNRENLKFNDSLIFIVGEGSRVSSLKMEIKGMPLFQSNTRIYEDTSLDLKASRELGDMSTIILDGYQFLTTPSARETLRNAIAGLRFKHRATTFVITLVVDDMYDFNDAIMTGADLLLHPGNPGLWTANLYGIIRALRTVVRPARPKEIEREQNEQVVEDWSFLPGTMEVRRPDKTKVSLQKAEWNFVQYLVMRDYHQSLANADQIKASISHPTNTKALVSKIKRKLGSDFPISHSSDRGYHLSIVKA